MINDKLLADSTPESLKQTIDILSKYDKLLSLPALDKIQKISNSINSIPDSLKQIFDTLSKYQNVLSSLDLPRINEISKLISPVSKSLKQTLDELSENVIYLEDNSLNEILNKTKILNANITTSTNIENQILASKIYSDIDVYIDETGLEPPFEVSEFKQFLNPIDSQDICRIVSCVIQCIIWVYEFFIDSNKMDYLIKTILLIQLEIAGRNKENLENQTNPKD